MRKKKGIISEYSGTCIICGSYSEEEHHFLFGTGMRPLAEEDGIKGDICRKCHTGAARVSDRIHDNPMAETLSKMVGQLAWEKHEVAKGISEAEARTRFRKRYGRSYL